jgi:hypothetical protein
MMPGDRESSGQWADLQAEAVTIVTEAGQAGITLRVVGSAGIRLHCGGPGPFMDLLNRPAKDIDFVVPEKHRKGMRRYLEDRGYLIDRDLLIAMEGTRYSFQHAERGTEIDVFVERLDFCHTIEVASRLHRHPVTLPVEELLLAKLQIVELTMTDLMDIAVVLATHHVSVSQAGASQVGPGGDNAETIDGGHIARIFARDWGFHHTATRNLARIRQVVGPGAGIDISEPANARVQDGVTALLAVIEAEPKGRAWRIRDRIGERKQWWQDVDDKEATY